MAKAHDIATYILSRCQRVSAMKLQKLIYYSQAWHLVWQNRALFDERIEAWAKGPVLPEIYAKHRGKFTLHDWPWGSADSLTAAERDTIDRVVDFYGSKGARWLSDLTHKERPWREARGGLAPGARGTREITTESMASYYGNL